MSRNKVQRKKADMKKKQNKAKLIASALAFKNPMSYDRFEWVYVKRSMLKIYHGYWHYSI